MEGQTSRSCSDKPMTALSRVLPSRSCLSERPVVVPSNLKTTVSSSARSDQSRPLPSGRSMGSYGPGLVHLGCAEPGDRLWRIYDVLAPITEGLVPRSQIRSLGSGLVSQADRSGR